MSLKDIWAHKASTTCFFAPATTCSLAFVTAGACVHFPIAPAKYSPKAVKEATILMELWAQCFDLGSLQLCSTVMILLIALKRALKVSLTLMMHCPNPALNPAVLNGCCPP